MLYTQIYTDYMHIGGMYIYVVCISGVYMSAYVHLCVYIYLYI